MKKYIFGVALLSAALLSGCSLDENPKSQFSEEEAFKNSTLTYVNSVANVYSAIGDGLYGGTDCVHTLAGVYVRRYHAARTTGRLGRRR